MVRLTMTLQGFDGVGCLVLDLTHWGELRVEAQAEEEGVLYIVTNSRTCRTVYLGPWKPVFTVGVPTGPVPHMASYPRA